MSKRKIFIVVLVLILALAAAFIFYWPKFQASRQDQTTANQRMEDLRQNNPGLLEKLLKSIADNEKLVKEKPGGYEAWLNLGVAYEALGQYSKAQDAYLKAIAANANNTVAWNNLAGLYIRDMQYDKAKDAFLKLLEFDPTDIGTYLNLAQMFADGHAGSIDDAKYILGQGILKTNSQTLKDAQERLNKEGKL